MYNKIDNEKTKNINNLRLWQKKKIYRSLT